MQRDAAHLNRGGYCRPTLAAQGPKQARHVRLHAKKERTQTKSRGFGQQQLPPPKQPSPVSSLGIQEQQREEGPGPALPTEQAVPMQPSPKVQPTSAALPDVSRGRVFAACAQVSGVIAAVGLLLRAAAPLVSPAVTDGHEDAVVALLQWPGGMTAAQVGLALAAATAVTAGRAALLQVWPEFKAASDRSNKQVLTPLQPLDLVWVAALPGISEELLFRGALIPAIYPDWRGVLIAGAAFGLLHNSGGRNPAFAAWASVVGCVYGFLFLSTQSVYAPMLAHSLANLASAALYLTDSAQQGQEREDV